MLSVASLLNPIKSDSRFPPSPCPSNQTFSSSYTSPRIQLQTVGKKQKMTKDGAIFAKGKIKGDVNFPPFEDLSDPAMVKEVQKFHVYPIGHIQDFSRHIPYNSEKKKLPRKDGTGEFRRAVFQYTFKLPGGEKEFVVMWDYNVGLVRITPFFKCCGYSKTTPAKMLHLNPGLKEITHSITGGSLAAQGYWMPYSCAFAVCATFCDHISGALIPIFGPTFPSACVSASSPTFGRFVIDPAIITTATKEAHEFRQRYSTYGGSSLASPSTTTLDSCSPRETFQDLDQPSLRATPQLGRHLRLKRALTNESMYTDTDISDASICSNDRYLYSPITPSSTTSPVGGGWKPLNARAATSAPRSALIERFETAHRQRAPEPCGPSPWLSAIPRSSVNGDDDLWSSRIDKRSAMEMDEDYDGEESASGSGSEKSDSSDKANDVGDMEKKAALLLMGLRVGDGEQRTHPLPSLQVSGWKHDIHDNYDARPRVKRRRAPSP